MTARSDYTEYPLKRKVTQYILNHAELHCDENELRKHLVRVLKYNETYASTLARQIVTFLNRERNQQDEPLQLSNKDISAEVFRVIIQCISPAERYEILSKTSARKVTAFFGGVTILTRYTQWKRNEIVEIILDSINEDECYNLLKGKCFSDCATSLHSACVSGNTELVMIIRRHVSKDNWYRLLLQISGALCNRPLQWAVAGGHIDIVKYIQASVTAEQWYESLKLTSVIAQTALHNAASSTRGHTEVMKFIHRAVTAEQWYELLQIKDNNGATAIHIAASQGHTAVIETIRETLPTVKWMSLLVVPPPPRYSNFIQYDTKGIEDFVRIEIKVQLAINSSSEQGNFNFSFAKFSRFLDKK